MDTTREFIIHFQGLKLGVHHFDYTLDAKFFEAFSYSELTEAAFKVKLNLEKKSNMMLLNFDFDGEIELLCDRCGGELQEPIVGEERLIVKYGEENYENTDDVIVISPTEYELDVSQYMFEFVALNVPYSRVHSGEEGSECDPGAINKLTEMSSKNEEQEIDQRWSALKQLLTDKE